MWLVIVYVLTLVIGETVVVALGLFLDKAYPPASLPVSLTLFFIAFWLAWIFAVRVTEPRVSKT